jgi:NADPH:quinone reductase-like Zn-dependent oxidoreductase
MKAYGVDSYGPIERIHLVELPEPEPGPGQVRIRVRASAVNPADLKVITGEVKFLHGRGFPLVTGYDFAGDVDKAGPGVAELKPGDRVFGFLSYGGGNKQGAFGEKIVARADSIARMPQSLDYPQAASAPTAALTALQGLRPALEGRPGKRVLVHGASGGVGVYALQIARLLGASSVTATCSAGAAEFVRGLGATEVLDYRQVELAALRERFDFLFDVVSNQSYFRVCRLLNPGGTYLTLLPSASSVSGYLVSPLLGSRCRMVIVKARASDLEQVARWFDEKRLTAPVDRTYPLPELAAALARLQQGGVRGKIAVDCSL